MSHEATCEIEPTADRAQVTDQRLGRYELRERIGESGSAVVFEAYDPRLERAVAIKKCAPLDEHNRERFLREAEVAASLKHPGIVQILDFGLSGDTPFIVQELLGGKDLKECVDSHHELSNHQRVQILQQIADGLAHAHGRGVVHRDLKPGNVRVLDDGTVKLLDCGVTTAPASLAPPVGLSQTATTGATTIGTAAYLSPEQIAGSNLNRSTDIFSFGVLAYELLAGHRPFEGETLSALLYRIANEEPEPLRAGAIPTRLSGLVSRCLDKSPAHRPTSFEAILEELKLILRDPRLAPPSAETVPIPIYPKGVPSSFRPPEQNLEANPDRLAGDRTGPGFVRAPARPTAPPLRDASNRVQAAKPRRRLTWLLVPVLLTLGAFALFAYLDGPLPEGLVQTVPALAALHSPRPATPEPAPDFALSLTLPALPHPEGHDAQDVPTPGEGALSERRTEVPLTDPVSAVVASLEAKRQGAPETPTSRVSPKETAFATGPATVFMPPSWHPAMQAAIDGQVFRTLDRRRTTELVAGPHKITFRLETASYTVRETIQLQLEPAETRTIPSPLSPPASLEVSVASSPREGILEVDGRKIALPLKAPLLLSPRSHRVTFHPALQDPLGPLGKTIHLRPETAHELVFDMRRRRAALEARGPFEWDG